MPLKGYGVLVGSLRDRRREPGQGTPHYQLLLQALEGHYRIAVNVQSAQSPSELLYVVYEDFRHPITDQLAQLPDGWTPIASQPGGVALDYIRGNIVNRADMRLLPADVAGADNDLADVLDGHVLRAIADPAARVFAFGEPWGPEVDVPDAVFLFPIGQGVHDIHMNQGNVPPFTRDDGVWQDGGLLIQHPAAGRWIAVFLAFQSQDWHTDDITGHGLNQQVEPRIQVVAALVNAIGGTPEAESVTLLNASPDAVDLTGWSLADRAKHLFALPAVQLAAGETLRVPLAQPFTLGNGGGTITLLDPAGLKVHGVAYTGAQAASEGWTVVP
jgi:uncharacterized protein YukJ